MNKILATSAVTAAVVFTAGATNAQLSDINQPLPNLLVALDTSGSMEYMPDGSMPVTCSPNASSDLNRWGTLIEVLTGTINNRSCVKVDRSTSQFKTEYRLSSVDPYDSNYHLPWHHYASNGCVSSPGVLPFSVFTWSQEPIRYRPWNDYTPNATCQGTTWSQLSDGLLDTYRDRVRFSLMMFDSHPDDGVGFVGAATNASSGFDGLWSYYNGWTGGGASPMNGHPADCSIQNQEWEVGARNFAAPPWEGRMVPFGASGAAIDEIRFNNDRIQEVITALRPYGGTPIDGIMDDIYVYFRTDMSVLPGPNNDPFAPAGDPLVNGGCRKSFVLLLSDGEPNLDLRPHCEKAGTPNGKCPYPEAWQRARDLFLGPPSVPTFAVGFGLSKTANYDCATLSMPADIQPGGACETATGGLKACCNLSRIAYEGGTGSALFADDPVALKSALAAVLDAVATQATSRTLPVFSSASTQSLNSQDAVAYEFGSAFVPTPGQLWSGKLERKRWKCEVANGVQTPKLQDVDPAIGDDFAENINTGSPPRKFLTVIGNTVLGDVHSTRSIRPNLSQNDGMGIYSGVVAIGDNATVANAVKAAPRSMGITSTPLPPVCTSPLLAAANDQDCAYKLMNWELGGNNGGGLATRTGAEFGAIYHSTPAVHDRPTAFIRDPAYERFADQQLKRPLVLYTATVDGQLHAFKVSSNDATDPMKADTLGNNELWSFLPPSVLPGIPSQYPQTPQILLDGAPVVKDVAFERTLGQAQAGGTTGGAAWRTVLVAGGAAGGGFYYALDVTNPYAPAFLWQVSTDSAGAKLFSGASGTPAIATVAIDEGTGVKEVAVALLPGGQGTPCNNTQPNRQSAVVDQVIAFHNGDLDQGITTNVIPGTKVRCWNSDGANSLTIVRLSDGKVLRQFRGTATQPNTTLNSALVSSAPFDSPLVHVVPYPNQTGQVANRAYLGDVDGTLWRVDLSKTNPTQWAAHLFFDAYPSAPVVATRRQPIPVKPVISVDGIGNTVLLFSTGDNEDFTSSSVNGTVWSVTEVPVAASNGVPFTVYANWVLSANTTPALKPGERVVGPLAVFDEIAYFATFTPPLNPQTCDFGTGLLYAVDFQDNKTGAIPPPQPRFPDGNNGFKYNPGLVDSPDLDGRTIFGVAVTAEPSCIDEVTQTDDYVGQHTTMAQSVPPTYKLRFHTGAEGTSAQGGAVNTGELQVPQPRIQSRIDSWASVVE